MTTYDEILGQLRSKLDEVVGLARDLVGEPSRAEVEREIAEALRHNAEGFRGTKGDATVGEWCRLWADDIEEGDYRKPRGTWWPLSSGAAENQPQPACPPDPVNSDDRDVADVAAALADARLAKGLSAPYYHSAIAALQRLASRCLVRRDPAPEAQRAQSPAHEDKCAELRVWKEQGVAWTHGRLDGLGVPPGIVGQSFSVARLQERMMMLRPHTPAPNIAAAVAELEEAVELDDWTDVRRAIRRALAHLQGGAK
jgi:hypothetical protein